MKVLYDHQAFDLQHFGGVSNCFVQLISNFPQGIEYDISLLECDNVHLRNSNLLDVPPMRLPYKKFIISRHFPGQGMLYGLYSKIFPAKTSYGRNRLYSIAKLKEGNFDVFHPTFFDPYFLPYLNGKPFVLTVHDMIPEVFHHKDFQVKVKPLLCRQAAHIVAVSNKTKQDLVNILDVPESKVTVIYHGAPEGQMNTSSKCIYKGKYILYVGQRDRYKSFFPMLRFLKPFLLHHQDINIVCTGPDFTRIEARYIQNAGLSQQVFHMQVSDQELQDLYAHAFCFIYPSIYEGFGIPILEAYHANCPVLLNESSCFPEIAGDAAIFFHLDVNSSDLDRVMENFYQMTNQEREALLIRQQQRLLFFSWKKSAQKLAELYASVV